MTVKTQDGLTGFEFVAAASAPYKAIASEDGWAFLINDTNDFLRIFFGVDAWTPDDQAKATSTISQRAALLRDKGIVYRKFIVPGKPVIYREYLPASLKSLKFAERRPAHFLAEQNPQIVHYLEGYFFSLKALGLVYFRGDTHPNWIGAWYICRFIMHHLSAGQVGPVINFRDLEKTLVPYDGDLIQHLSAEALGDLRSRFGHTMPENGIELVIKLDIAIGYKARYSTERQPGQPGPNARRIQALVSFARDLCLRASRQTGTEGGFFS